MKIAVDVLPIQPDGKVGGAHHLVIELLKGLFNKNGTDEFFLLTTKANHNYFIHFENDRVNRICIDSEKKPSLLRELKAHVLFCPMTAVSCCEPMVPAVSVIHDIQHEYYPQFFSKNELLHRKSFYKEVYNKADAVICVSNFTKNTIIEKFKFPPEKIHVIHNSIQDRLAYPLAETQTEILQKYSIQNKTYALYPANFWPHKNHRMLLVAFSMLTNKYPELNLDLILTGSLWDEAHVIKEAISQMNLLDRVHYIGYLSDEDLSAVLAGAKMVIFPSLFEGFGIPIIEAMKFGIPVLCSDTTSIPEIGGDAVKYFDPRRPGTMVTAIKELLDDEQLQRKMKDSGVKRITKFNLSDMIDSYYAVLKHVSENNHLKGYHIEGLYSDGWTGSDVLFHLEACDDSRVLELNMIHPFLKVKLSILVNGKKIDSQVLYPSKSKKVLIEAPCSSSVITIRIKPTFNPSDSGSEDTRELGVQLNNINVRSKSTGAILSKMF